MEQEMRKTQSLSITLPREMAKLVKDKVASGAYATESEVIREGLRALGERDAVLEQWLRTEGVARYDAYHRNPQDRPAAKVFARLRQHHAKRMKRDA
jgi:putative addiction module CopG family antidote